MKSMKMTRRVIKHFLQHLQGGESGKGESEPLSESKRKGKKAKGLELGKLLHGNRA
jgi:hypothetical protein